MCSRQETETDVPKIEHGLVAQLGERRVRNAEVEGSIPFESTNDKNRQVSTRNLSINFFIVGCTISYNISYET